MRPDIPSSPQPRSAVTDFTVDHGPADLLATVFLRAENAIRSMGVQVSTGTLEELAEVNAAHRDSWLPLFPIYQPECWPGDDVANTYCLLGRDDSGRVVTTVALRNYHWPASTFHEEATSLRLFYGDPPRFRRPDERCTVTATAARRIGGRVALAGAFWIHPDRRGGQQLPRLMGALIQSHCIAKWNVDAYTVMMSDSVFKRGLAKKCAWGNVDWAVELHDCLFGNLNLCFIWLTRAEILQDLSKFLVELGPQTHGVVGQHGTEQHLRP